MTTPNKDIETTIDPVDSLSDDLSPSDSIERTEVDDATDSVPQGADPQSPETPSDTYHSTLEDDGTYRTVLDYSDRPNAVSADVVRRLLESGDNAALTKYLLERTAPPHVGDPVVDPLWAHWVRGQQLRRHRHHYQPVRSHQPRSRYRGIDWRPSV